jgi:hypothetical protein
MGKMQYLVKPVQNQENCNLSIFKQYITQSYWENVASGETCLKQVNFGPIFVCLIDRS